MFRQSTFEGVRRRGLLAAIVALVAFAAVPLGGAPEPAYAGPPEDAVLDWNLHAINALVNAPRPRPTRARVKRRRFLSRTSRWCRGRSTTQ